MNEILDMLPVPAERDFPPGRLDARRDALVAAIRLDMAHEPFARRVLRAARGQITRSWLSLLGILALGIALVAIGCSGQQRPSPRGAVALLAVAGTAQVAAAAVVPRARRTSSVVPGAR
jgi:hypothetical protein